MEVGVHDRRRATAPLALDARPGSAQAARRDWQSQKTLSVVGGGAGAELLRSGTGWLLVAPPPGQRWGGELRGGFREHRSQSPPTAEQDGSARRQQVVALAVALPRRRAPGLERLARAERDRRRRAAVAPGAASTQGRTDRACQPDQGALGRPGPDGAGGKPAVRPVARASAVVGRLGSAPGIAAPLASRVGTLAAAGP